MTRTRATAKKAGATFERMIADYLALALEDDRIDRRVKTGNKDRGDIGGVRMLQTRGGAGRVVIECKNTATLSLSRWAAEAETERGNDDALAGVIVHKRHGRGDPGDQWVTMTMHNFAALLAGGRP